MTDTRFYCLYGLRIASEVELPELPPAPRFDEPEVQISIGPVEEHGAGVRVLEHATVLEVAGVARYSIHAGKLIVVDPVKSASARNVRLFLLGSAIGLLVHQRGLLPVHANTVMIGNKAVIFMGPSGAGKSTLAAWFHELGHTVLGDDVCVVRVNGQRPTVSAGLPRLRLWKNSLEALGRDHADYPLSYTGKEGLDKYDVTLDGRTAPQGEIELGAIYDLAKGQRTSVCTLSGLNAAEAIIANTYRGEYVGLVGNARDHWEACVRLAQQTPAFRIERPWDLIASQQVVKLIVKHSAAIAGTEDSRA